jgi:UDP-N-acetylglucosamine--N-acetylmuramyl-(pentapeptide) pyrophosphoryl-undecaprenol N-acetylglucosamine transferase
MKIILATGGSGGHIFPALKTAQRLRIDGHEVLFVGALRFAEGRLKQTGFAFKSLDIEGLNSKSFPGIVSFIYRMIKATARSVGILSSYKAEAVAGFGSYSSFPVILAARLLGIPALIHEQNVIPGKANRLSCRLAKRIAITFEETRKYISARDIVRTGCPCNSERSTEPKRDLLNKFQLQANRLTILVLGGSQGSRYLNEVVFETLPYLQAERDIQVIHMTGRTDYSLYAEKYAHLKIPFCVCEFIENIQEAYSIADLVVARAGAGSVCEIAAFGLPSILVPYPFAGAHQAANASILQKAGVSVVIDQKDLTRGKLLEAVHHLAAEDLTPSLVRSRLGDFLADHPTEQLVKVITDLKK